MVDDLGDRNSLQGHGLARRLGLVTVTALVVGEVIGVGIFLTPAGMIRSLGSPFWLLVVWLTMGAGAIGGALSYGALAARYPEAGGGYVYLKEAYGPRMAFLYGWMSLFVTDPGLTAMLAAGLANYIHYLIPLSTWELRGVAVTAIIVLAVLNMMGVSLGSGTLHMLVALKLGLLSFLVVWGLGMGHGDWSNLTPFWVQRRDPMRYCRPLLSVLSEPSSRMQAGGTPASLPVRCVIRSVMYPGAYPGCVHCDRRLRRRQRCVSLSGACRQDHLGRYGLRGTCG